MTAVYPKPIPQEENLREKCRKSLVRRRNAVQGLAFGVAILSLLALIGVIAAMFVLEFANLGKDLLLFSVMGGLAVVACGCALAAYILLKRGIIAEQRIDDFSERCDSEESFLVGETTLATFGADGVVLHDDAKTPVQIPYAELRFFSVCLRKRMRERGEWTVLIELPARYLQKDADGETTLIRTDAKPRLYAAIAAHGLDLRGETPPSDLAKGYAQKKFKAEKKFYLPDPASKRRALLLGGIGLAAACAGVALGVLVNLTVGILIGVLGAAVVSRAVLSALRSRARFVICEEGVFWRDTSESVFLKWEEIAAFRKEEKPAPVLAVDCSYGVYRFPRAAGVWEELQRTRGKLCR